ncbi:hypothetical protein FZEAL_1882 [Fusarium zealandicum]|uniref:Fungal lipase-type domain-containing protein n=1 Tax=Fusarium zealandicum TaxID=1053134 RepID=A0A8H4XNZ0_9HYPO|nr:hypothetical protein FZEAL_1882 [Fusarium zealandicum]
MGSSTSRRVGKPSGSAMSVDNSLGASAAAVELSGALSETLQELDLGGNYSLDSVYFTKIQLMNDVTIGSLSGQLKRLLQQLDQEASKYTNSEISDDGASNRWNCSQAEAQLVSAAWKCARTTYDLESTLTDTTYCRFRHDHVLKHSITGTVKAMTSTVVEPVAESDLLPVLVIAVRGSANKMDHIVNANSGPKATDDFLHLDLLNQPDVQAHSGFLNSAWALDDIISERINKYIKTAKSGSGRKPRILFTGHSAGGAVASLFYLHYLSNQGFAESASFSCVTFGAPPCLTAPIDLSSHVPSSKTLCLNIINEFDIVSRADKPYILSLVDLVRSKLELPTETPVSNQDRSEDIVAAALDATQAAETAPLPSLSSFYTEPEGDFSSTDPNFWRLPQPLYHHVGTRVVFAMRLAGHEIGLRAVEVPPLEFQQLLFCRIAVHFKARYGERVEMLESGRFNHRLGWEDRHTGVV